MAGERVRRDTNNVTGLLAESSDGLGALVPLYADPSTHALVVQATISTAGLATSAKQDTGNTSLASIDGKIPALGQALAAASMPVILPAATITALTPPPAITGFATAAKQPALGSAGSASTDVLTVQGITSMTPLKVDPSGVTSPVSNAGTFAVQATLQAQTDTVMVGGVNIKEINAVTPLMGNGATGTGSLRVTIASDNTAFSVNAILQAGSALVGKVGIDQTTPGTTNAVVDTPVTSGGLSIITGSIGATATAIKASAGQLYGYHLFNTTAAVAYVQVFNVAAGSVTLGTTAPTFSIGIPASGGVTINFDKGIAFSTAISFACTTTRAGSVGATCDVNFFYK